MTRRRRSWVALAVALVAVVPACSDDDVAADEARLTVSGVVTLTPPGGAERIIYSGQDVEFGNVIRVDEGTATIELADGGTYELRAARGDVEAAQVEVGAVPRVVAGDVLLSDGFPTAVMIGDVRVTARGATLVSADVPSVESFVGDAQLTGAGDVTEVPALRSVVLGSGATPRPLQIDITDPWVRRYLEDAYTMGQRLEALSLGYTADLRSTTELTADFFGSIVPELDRESEFTDAVLTPGRPAGETLVGAVITLAATDGTFRDRWASVFGMRDEGAGWGLVALAHGVRSTPVVDSIEVALGASPLSDDPPPPSTTTPSTTTEPEEEPDTPRPTPSPTTTTTVPPTTSPPTTTPDNPGILVVVLSPVTDLLDELLMALGLG